MIARVQSYAQAFFHSDWNSWVIGYYDPSLAGRAQGYTTAADEATARRIADDYNLHGGVDPIFCHNPRQPCRVESCPWGKTVVTLTVDQLKALVVFSARHGRRWKSELNHAWTTGRYGVSDATAELQQIRNTFGPSWLVRFAFNKTSTHSVRK